MKGRFGLALRDLMIATAAMALGFASFGVFVGGILSIAVFIVALHPFSSRWKTWELAATAVWLLGAVLVFSNVVIDIEGFLLILVSGFMLGCTWALRAFVWWATPSSRAEWPSLLLTPSAMTLAFALLLTDLDFRLRLALSEPALLADAQRILSGRKETRSEHARRIGLFWASRVENDQGGVLWRTGGTISGESGVAYFPGATPTNSGRWFWHIHGPWWRFVASGS